MQSNCELPYVTYSFVSYKMSHALHKIMKMGKEEEKDGYVSLFETKKGKGRLIKRIWSLSMFLAISLVLLYRATHLGTTKVASIVLLVAELWFSFYWFLTQIIRWSLIYRFTFKHRLLSRYGRNLPKVDIFVCTADAEIEPPIMVINTVLSVMAYDYPTQKLSIYLSDDGCSILTFYALFEASIFSKHWLPYCRKYGVEPRAPAPYFESLPKPVDATHSTHLASIKKLYEEMQERIEKSTKLGQIPAEVHGRHRGFSKWNDSYTSKHDHDTILQILIDGSNEEEKDVEGIQLPTLVYLAREKRPQHFHNFKAGAMNALIRVSSQISNAPIILNVDCDMYSNNSKSILDAFCFFMDEKKSQDIAFVQFPQLFENVTKNDIYGTTLRVISEVEFPGIDGLGGPMYIGSGCFHRRDVLCGKTYTKEYKIDWKSQNESKVVGTIHELEERAKPLGSSTYELNTQWGKEMGLSYGCAVEDVMSGLVIQCRGWKSVYMNTERGAFLGLAPTTLADTLVQHKRWSEGDFQIMLNHCPFWYGHNKISLAHQLAYSHYCFWALNSLAVFPYCIIPSLYMLSGVSLFPHISSPWFLPFVYIVVAKYAYSLAEFLCSGGTVRGWWNEQRIWLYKRTSSYLFTMVDMILKIFKLSEMKFVITTKVTDEDVSRRYNQEIMEFGVPSPMFVVLTGIALINLFALVLMMMRLLLLGAYNRQELVDRFGLQIMLSGALVLINMPIYEAVFVRKDKGKMPTSVTMKATFVALLASTLFYK